MRDGDSAAILSAGGPNIGDSDEDTEGEGTGFYWYRTGPAKSEFYDG